MTEEWQIKIKKWQNKGRCISKEDEINNKSDWRKINMIKKKDAKERRNIYECSGMLD